MLDALDRDGFNAVGYSLGGLVKALDGSGDADVVDLTGGVGRDIHMTPTLEGPMKERSGRAWRVCRFLRGLAP